MAKINHDALAPFVGIVLQHDDGSWNQYGQPYQGATLPEMRTMAKEIYGGAVPTRVVVWRPVVLCDAADCQGHADIDDACVTTTTTDNEPRCVVCGHPVMQVRGGQNHWINIHAAYRDIDYDHGARVA